MVALQASLVGFLRKVHRVTNAINATDLFQHHQHPASFQHHRRAIFCRKNVGLVRYVAHFFVRPTPDTSVRFVTVGAERARTTVLSVRMSLRRDSPRNKRYQHVKMNDRTLPLLTSEISGMLGAGSAISDESQLCIALLEYGKRTGLSLLSSSICVGCCIRLVAWWVCLWYL